MKINMDVIIRDDNPLLREKSVDVTLPLSAEDKELLTAMITYVRDSRDEELAERRKTWVVKEPNVSTGYLRRYAKMVKSASYGAVVE